MNVTKEQYKQKYINDVLLKEQDSINGQSTGPSYEERYTAIRYMLNVPANSSTLLFVRDMTKDK